MLDSEVIDITALDDKLVIHEQPSSDLGGSPSVCNATVLIDHRSRNEIALETINIKKSWGLHCGNILRQILAEVNRFFYDVAHILQNKGLD